MFDINAVNVYFEFKAGDKVININPPTLLNVKRLTALSKIKLDEKALEEAKEIAFSIINDNKEKCETTKEEIDNYRFSRLINFLMDFLGWVYTNKNSPN